MEDVNTNVTNEISRLRSDINRCLDAIDRSRRRIAIQPVIWPLVQGQQNEAPIGPPLQRVVQLSKCPKDLYALWHEYEFGVGGTKPARTFTAIERGANKFSFSWRKVFWDLVSSMILWGYTSDAAIHQIYGVYGRGLSVSSILLQMRADQQTGGHPELAP